MAHLTNGTVSYERRVKTGDFEHKHAAVTIHYALDAGDNADELISFAGSLAANHVFKILRAQPVPVGSGQEGVAVAPVVGPVVVPFPGPAPVPIEPVVAVETDDERLARTGSYTDEIIPPVTNLKAAKRAVAKKVGPVIIVSQTDVVVEESPLMRPVAIPEVSSHDRGQPLVIPTEVIEDFTADAPAATDAELGQVLGRINAKLKDGPRIRALIGEFVQSGQSYTMIPAVRRGEFVSRLEALA